MTSEFDSTNVVQPDFEDGGEDDFDEEESLTLEDLRRRKAFLLKEPAKVLADFLTDFTETYERGIQGPIPIPVLRNMDRLSALFDSALQSPNRAGYVSLEFNNVDLGELGALVYFAACGGEEEIVLGDENHEPYGGPLDLAILDLQEAFVRAGGKDNPGLRKMFESLGREETGN